MNKFKKLIALFICTALTMALVPAMSASAADFDPVKPAMGSGTSTAPYEITNAAELYWFAGLVNGTLTDGTARNQSACAVLKNDITVNINVVRDDGTLIGSGSNFAEWVPIGNSNYNYTGTFDGNGYTINGLYANRNSYCTGLFGYTGSKAVIKNVNVAKSYIAGYYSSSNAYIGSICAYNGGTIENCVSSATVYTLVSSLGYSIYIGGICSYNIGIITDCVNKGDVIQDQTSSYYKARYIGGICGYNYSGTVQDCYNTGNVNAQLYSSSSSYYSNIGGINGSGSAKGCYSTGAVTVEGQSTYDRSRIGGITGSGSATDCYNLSDINVSGSFNYAYIGGIAGYGSTIENCYNLKDLSATNTSYYLGGISGYSGNLINCYNIGAITGFTEYLGGLIGSGGTAGYSYYIDTNERAIGSGGTLTNSEAKSAEQFASGEVAWLLNGEYSGGLIWHQDLGSDPSPVRDDSHGTVYRGYEHGGDVLFYSNSPLHESANDHDSFFKDGICSVCGKSQVEAVSITLDKSSLSLTEGDEATLTATILPENASNKKVIWASDNESVATVENGVVKAIKKGKANITASTADGKKTASCAVTVYSLYSEVTGVTLDKTEATIYEGEVLTLTATVSPSNAANKNVTWESSDPSVAMVMNGVVAAIKEGMAVITVTTEDGGKTASCTVTVAPRPVSVSSVSLSKSSVTMNAGEVVTITATIAPENATNKNVIWTSSDDSVAVVLGGNIVGLKPGKATITVTTEDGGKTATCAVTVNANDISVSSITLDKTEAVIAEGESISLKATVLPDNAANKTVIWTSSDTSVAVVNNGTVTAKKSGITAVIATTENGGKAAACLITVEPKPTADGPSGYSVNSLGVESIGSSVSVSASITKNSYLIDEDVIVIAMYKDDVLIDILFMRATFDHGKTVSFGGMMAAVKGAQIRAFVWDSMDNMTPLSNTLTYDVK